MANGVNKVILVGNLGRDPEVRHLESGTSVATFPIATTESYTDRDGNKQSMTEWHNIVLWRGLATVAERYLKKGSKIYVEGRLTTRSYEKDGVTRYVTEVVGRDMVMLDNRTEGGSSMPGYEPPMNEPAMGGSSNVSPVSTSTESTSSGSDSLGGDDPDDLPF
ncbi:single-stranded DNA-binding protein [Limibacter armeniacum]|uniref:single-stranded DNA-binding protein n=1 Tax=Limibacter armeniacum TaxID=466084 RepID=UPI002FE5A417